MILASALGAMAPTSALGQSGAPASAPSAKPKADKPSGKDGESKPAGKDKKDAPAASASAAAAAGSAAATSAPAGQGGLPAGHPPVNDGLPAGHPAVDDDDHDAAPQPNPHGGSPARDPRIFQAPPDNSEEDGTLPVGSIVATIRDAQDQPLPRAPLTLEILRNTVAKGESSDRRDVVTDSSGSARFDGLTTGSGVTYRIITKRGQATYSLPAFALNDRAGRRAVLHAYETSSEIEEISVGMQEVAYISLKEDSIQVEQLISVFNLGAISWIADTTFSLPPGFKAFNKQETMSDSRIDEVKGTGAALRGTFPPGRRDISFRYQVPLEDKARQTLRIELPPHVAQARVLAESSKSMGLEVTGFPTPQQTRRDGKRLLVTERQMTRNDRGLSTIEVTLTGLPTTGPGRWIAVVLALAALGVGVGYTLQKYGDPSMDPEARGDLIEAREALLSEIVALERAHKSGEVGPQTYARLRAALLDSLARIVSMLDVAKAQGKKRRREARTVESAS
jgi:hypothetical protein